MKKLMVSLLALSVTLPVTSAHASELKAAKLKTGGTDYEATILKDTKVMNHGTYGNYDYKSYFSTLSAGSKVVITEHKLVNGYNFFVLKGNRYLPVDDSLIKINKKLSTDIQSGKGYLTNNEKLLLKQNKNKKYYKEYEAFLKSKDNGYHRWLEDKENTMTLSLIGLDGSITEEAMMMIDYDNWYKGRKNIGKAVTDKTKVDVLSKKFKDGFINSRSNVVAGYKRGDSARKVFDDYGAYNKLHTAYGDFQVGNYAGYQTDKSYKKVSKLMYTSKKKVSYKDWIAAYGKPSSETFKADKNIEHILTYNKSKYGYKVIVGFDSYKGYVKYILKEKVK